jgi:hypothetical protein
MSKYICAAAFVLAVLACGAASAGPRDLDALGREVAGLPLGERIARIAESFVGTPYDPDPQGSYVTRRAIVADDRVDCMYLTFRAVELALGGSPAEAEALALALRFRTHGRVEGGTVLNYEDRFEYGMDMLASGKWGEDVTRALLPGSTVEVAGSRGHATVAMLPRERVAEALPAFLSGDIVYFVKRPARRVVGEIVGHMGIVRREGDEVYLIHASGGKGGGGEVVKLPLAEYARTMPFVGIVVGRLAEGQGIR